MYTTHKDQRICQGDILENFTYDLNFPNDIGLGKIRLNFPYAIVLTQDCDLSRDYEIRFTEKEYKNYANQLFTILICPMFIAEMFKEGNHLEELGIKGTIYNKHLWSPVVKNNNPRTHYLPRNEEVGLPDLIIDFKYFYTFPIEPMYTLKSKLYKARVADLYKESISQRFSNYLSRIPLPDQL